MSDTTATPAPTKPTSRVCVKNLPAYVSDDRLRALFAAQADVTDVKIMRTRYGESRKFGFVGFRTPEAAAKALQYFNKSFLDTARLHVEFAMPVGSTDLSRPWSKYSEGSSRHSFIHRDKDADKSGRQGESSAAAEPETELEKNVARISEDAALREFLAVKKPRAQAKVWANDDEQGLVGNVDKMSGANIKNVLNESDDEDEAFNNPALDRKTVAKPVIVVTDVKAKQMDAEKKEAKTKKDAVVVADSKPAVSDLDWLRSKVMQVGSDDDNDSDDSGEDDNETKRRKENAAMQSSDSDVDSEDELELKRRRAKLTRERGSDDESDDGLQKGGSTSRSKKDSSTVAAKEAVSNDEPAPSQPVTKPVEKTAEVADVGESGRLFVRNLPFSVSEDEMRELFGQYGNISEIHIPLDSAKRCKGFAYITYMFPEHAVKALEGADGAIFQGRLIHILPALPAIESTTTATSTTDATTGSTSSYKLAKEATLKKAANKEESWNSFFVPAASVLTAMAKALGVSKADIITDTHSEDGAKNKMHAAVRMALSETQVIAETKTWLAAQGVNLAAFDDSKTKERSNTALLLKNFPFDSTEEELRRLVTKFGTVTRFLLPPNHTLAMCEFAHSQEARQAFRGLAFKRFKSAPLYMEWAPQAAFNPIVVTEPAAETKADEPSTDGLLATDNGNADSLSLFVKNLNFDTTEEKLKSTFEQIGAVRSATIAKKKNTKTSGKDKDKAFLSMGFGFVEFVSTAHAHDALRKLQNVEVDGHRLQLKLSQRGESAPTTETATGKRKTAAPEVSLAPSTKILVKNLAFEAGPKDLRQLFSTFGQVKSVRMPKKFDGTHRGFGFVELVTKQEALNAYKALADTHLYGRHLVMQWANADDGVDELRQKSALQAEIERNDGFNVNAASKKRKTAVTIDSNDKSFAAAFGASME